MFQGLGICLNPISFHQEIQMTHLQQIMNDNVNGGTFISINTNTDVKLTGGKKNPQQGLVTKVTEGLNVMVFQNKKTNAYQNMVNKRLKQEGKMTEFEVGTRKWGTRMEGQPFVEHNGQHYLEVICLGAGTSHYEVNGIETAASNIEGLPAARPQMGQGGLGDIVILRTYKVNSITSITINKQTFNDNITF